MTDECQGTTICISYCQPNGSMIVRDERGREEVIDRGHRDYRWSQTARARLEAILTVGGSKT